ncbi:hypothetical protein HHK36_020416 [Tetracentron sinense]|uniref:DUF3741 domain-containing protein n=1 Tax=Tetracentron sinense TaxID=13715 RepID=A0A834YRK5_TETSI|nr:hypothetical protein HHK36_020416 [Tetracentron sinense]
MLLCSSQSPLSRRPIVTVKPANLRRTFPYRFTGKSYSGDLAAVEPKSRHSRSRSEVAKMLNPIGDQIEDTPGSELRMASSNKKSNGTPLKMLMAQEMSKVMVSKQKPPSVVAKLMGLDALPGQQPDSDAQRNQQKGYSRGTLTLPGSPLRYWQQENGSLDKQMQCGVHPYQEQKEYKDVYEVWQKSGKTNYIRDKSSQNGRYNENPNEKRMAIVRQKFIEAKRLATDENLHQSKEFQDALEILSSNEDLFLKFLQEPNSLFPQNLYELQSVPPPPQAKHITVLRPKTVENNIFVGPERKSEKQKKKLAQEVEANGWNKNKHERDPVFTNQKADNSTQPTRIVVLKPNLGKTHDNKAMVSSPSSSPRLLHNNDFYGHPENDEARESREVTKKIMRQMSENLSCQWRDETLLSSVFSNGYIGDESSFNRSEKEYIEGNLSDSEVLTPTSRHSWDYINRFGSPYSSSSFSRASYSPESLVCRETKKRLSERLALMASNESGQERRQARRSSSKLGEMLALSDIKKSIRPGEEGDDGGLSILKSRSCGGEQETRGTTSCLTSRNKDDGGEDYPRNLLRSRSVPVSSTAYAASLNGEVPDPEVSKSLDLKEVVKSKSEKSSFKAKVSSLFFSKNKKPWKENSGSSPSLLPGSIDESQSAMADVPEVPKQPSYGKISNDIPQSANNSGIEMELSLCLEGLSKMSSPASICVVPKQGTISSEAGLSLAKPGNPSENQDQPSPISVLDAPFEENVNSTRQSSGNVKSDRQGILVHLHPLKSNLIDKSPPIESIARTLSRNDSCSETSTPIPLNPFTISPEAEEHERFLFVQTLLSTAGLDGEEQSVARWHSSESPLDPSLIDKWVDLKDNKKQLSEAKRRQHRSNQRLLFDCVNVALVDITGNGSDASPWARASSGVQDRISVGALVMVDEVWGRMKELFSSEGRCFSGVSGENNSLVVERVVRKEVVGRGCLKFMRFEVDCIGKEIEGKMLEELVEETLVEVTGELR